MHKLTLIGKLIIGVVVGVGIGLLIGLGSALLFTDITWSQLTDKLAGLVGMKLVILVLETILGMIAAVVTGIVVHETGHLIMGLFTGYHFVSFRVFSLTLIRTDGHYQLKRFSLGGTGGQCLMRPPMRPLDQIDTRWYNAGGVLMNVITMAVCLLLFWWSGKPAEGSRLPEWLELFLLMSIIINAFYALLNGIPLRMGGIGNDGYNLLHLEKHPDDKRALYLMLEANALVQQGTPPKDLPAEWFDADTPVNWADGIQSNWQMMKVAFLLNRREWDKAYALLADAMVNKDLILGLFQRELTAEMVFVCLVTNRIDEARRYWTDDVATYVRQYAKTQSSKQRILHAVSLLLEADNTSAQTIHNDLIAKREHYLLQGEVAMDLELMDEVEKLGV